MKTFKHWGAFFQFLRRPDYLQKEEGIKNQLILTFNSLLLKILITVPLLLLYGWYINQQGTIPETMVKNVEELYSPVILFTMVAIFEEFAFRGFLTRFNPLLFSISTAGISAYYYKKIAYNKMFFEPDGLLETGILAIIIFGVSFFLATKYRTQLAAFWEKHFAKIVYGSAFLFAFVHFFNSATLELAYLKTIIFQLIGALILTFVRIRAGLFYAILIHFIWDLFL